MMMTSALFSILMLSARAEEGSAALAVHRLQLETADRIQSRLVEPILGPGQAGVMVSLSVETKLDHKSSGRTGEGKATRSRVRASAYAGAAAKAAADTTELSGPGSEQYQESRQLKGSKEEASVVSMRFPTFHVLVVHDSAAVAVKLEKVREAILEAYRFDADLKPADVRFLAAEFHPSWRPAAQR